MNCEQAEWHMLECLGRLVRAPSGAGHGRGRGALQLTELADVARLLMTNAPATPPVDLQKCGAQTKRDVVRTEPSASLASPAPPLFAALTPISAPITHANAPACAGTVSAGPSIIALARHQSSGQLVQVPLAPSAQISLFSSSLFSPLSNWTTLK